MVFFIRKYGSLQKNIKNDFIIALKSTQRVALSLEDKRNKAYVSIETLQPGQQTVEIWFKKLDFPLLLTKQVFKNENGTVGELYLACSDLNLSYDKITTIYRKRWAVEEYHKSIKSNTGFAKSPTKKPFCLIYCSMYKIRTAKTKNW